MSDRQIFSSRSDLDQKLDVQVLWSKYEDIAMHFNDLLMRLRTQALAGVAAISTLVGVFTKTDAASVRLDWLVASCVFAALAFFWVAICCVDLLYYNRLLVGAVTALKNLEANIGTEKIRTIKLSTQIIAEFETKWVKSDKSSFTGVFIFYGIVFFVLVSAAIVSLCMHYAIHDHPMVEYVSTGS